MTDVSFEQDPELENVLLVRLAGPLEVASVDKVWNRITEQTSGGRSYLLFDFSKVPIVTSAGIGMLVRALIRLQNRGGSLAVFGCDDKICEVFKIVMLKQILNVSDSVDAARDALREAGAS